MDDPTSLGREKRNAWNRYGDEIVAQLDPNTNEASERGVFGAPTMFVDGSMFFGNDRLEFVREELDQHAALRHIRQWRTFVVCARRSAEAQLAACARHRVRQAPDGSSPRAETLLHGILSMS